jgi:hypothetical protein
LLLYGIHSEDDYNDDDDNDYTSVYASCTPHTVGGGGNDVPVYSTYNAINDCNNCNAVGSTSNAINDCNNHNAVGSSDDNIMLSPSTNQSLQATT